MAAARTLPPAKLTRYEKLVAAFPDVEVKGAKSAYTSLSGHMTSFLTEDGTLALRLPADARAEVTTKHGARPCVQHGHPMKEYVLIPEALASKPAALRKLFAASLAHVGSLKPKPTTRKKGAAGSKSKAGSAKRPARKA